ncbi:hypothetical protein D3C78_1607790 [compost metagenome]
MTAKNEAAHILNRYIKLLCNECAITGCIQNTGLANDAVFRKTKRVVSRVGHRINGIA